ncbi:Glycosyl transferase family 2 [Marinococcus luteus]|uniref:Glycosyl transferase family 2 n=1 Tax=Marinococcus luteus TaxID=1122204 RepID=A0A1H2TGE7_9BACI|nr:glycosyltransferase family 2 protein [Marinococcus luteus]SDW42755.1 Glycosyl transferase family 2 [Marinococcus luteus]
MKSNLKIIIIKTFKLIPPRTREKIIIMYLSIVNISNVIKNVRKTKKTLNYIKKEQPILYKNSKKALWRYCFRQTDSKKHKEYLDTYARQNVKCIQQRIKSNLPYDEPILICAVKNDIRRIKMQLDHHRELGIVNFVYIDNMSDDGTYEWLINQGVDVYRVEDKFSATAKNAWFRQVTDKYGYNRWYIILDSDELFVYPGMEEGKIHNLIKFAEREKMNFLQSFMIDMYSKEQLNNNKPKEIDITKYDIKKYNCFFDKDNYYILPSYKGERIHGGSRARLFSDSSHSFAPLLTKNPLYYLKKEEVFGVHYTIPYYDNFNKPIISGILHYKFLPEDSYKYTQIVKEGNYANGSAEYKQYLKIMEEQPNLHFFNNNSQKFNSSFDLLTINIFNKNMSEKLVSYIKQSSK